MPHTILRRITVNPLGSGNSAGANGKSNVFESLDVLSSTTVAIKVISLYDTPTSQALNPYFGRLSPESMLLQTSETDLGTCPETPNLIKSFDTSIVNTNTEAPLISFTTEIMDGGTLIDLYASLKRLNVVQSSREFEGIISHIALSILKGLESLNSRGIVHNDIKPANILVNLQGNIKISDFGSCQFGAQAEDSSGSNYESYSGTIKYMSPCRVGGKSHSYNSDVWSLGIMLYEICSSQNLNSTLLNASNDDPLLMYLPQFSANLNDFLSSCCVCERTRRPSASDLLLHPFVANCKTRLQLNSLGESCIDQSFPTFNLSVPLRSIPRSDMELDQVLKQVKMSLNALRLQHTVRGILDGQANIQHNVKQLSTHYNVPLNLVKQMWIYEIACVER